MNLAGVVAFAVLAVILFYVLRALRQIHVLVNSRLTEALEDIAALKAALVTARRRQKP